jgi:hypothetical protein
MCFVYGTKFQIEKINLKKQKQAAGYKKMGQMQENV